MPISGTRSDGDEISFNDAEVEIDEGGTGSFVNFESWVASVAAQAQTRDRGQLRLHDGNPVVSVSQLGAGEATVTVLYTEGTGDPFNNIYDAHMAGTLGSRIDIRYNKNGAIAGDNQFTTSGGKLTSCDPPSTNADDSTPTTITFTLAYAALTRTTIV